MCGGAAYTLTLRSSSSRWYRISNVRDLYIIINRLIFFSNTCYVTSAHMKLEGAHVPQLYIIYIPPTGVVPKFNIPPHAALNYAHHTLSQTATGAQQL